jgi:predicted DsbA family dithiol-disulfide isomerase
MTWSFNEQVQPAATSVDLRLGATALRQPMIRIDIWADVICPHCWISEIRLYQAIRKLGIESLVDIRARCWRMGLAEIGGQGRGESHVEIAFAMMHRRLETLMAESKDLGLRVEAARLGQVATLDAHRLLRLGVHQERTVSLLARLHRAYFLEGLDIADRPTLKRLAVRQGYAPREVDRMLQNEAGAAEVAADEAYARRLGATDVPFIVLDGYHVLRGVQTKMQCVTALARILTGNARAVARSRRALGSTERPLSGGERYQPMRESV